MVGMVVGDDDARRRGRGSRRSSARAGRGRNRPAGFRRRCRSGSTSAGGGCAARRDRTRPSHSRSAAPPTRSRSRESAPSRGRFPEQGEEVARRALRRDRRTSTPRSPATKFAVSTTNAGSHVLPRLGTGARNGASVSTSSRSSGTVLRGRLEVGGILEGHDPRQRDVEAEAERDVGQFLAAGEAVEHPGDAPLPHFAGEDLGGVVLGIAGVDDERQARSRAPPRYAPRSARAARRGRSCRNNNRARIRRSRSPAGACDASTSAAAPRSGCASASCG